jgi:uncharacterized FlaG/YvyC family protein
MKTNYVLTVTDEDTDEVIGQISGYSEESLLEQLRKIDHSIARYKEEKILESMAIIGQDEE